MFKLTATKRFISPFYGRWLDPGDWLLIEDNNVLSEDGKRPALGRAFHDFGKLEQFDMYSFAPQLDWNQLKPGDEVLIHRAGGIGDIAETLPIVYELRAQGAGVTLCSEDRFDSVLPLLGSPPVRRRGDYGVEPVDADWMVTLEGIPEQCMGPTHTGDLYVERTLNPPDRLRDPAQKQPGGFYFEAAQSVMADWLEKNAVDGPDGEVVIASKASAHNRSIPLLERLPDAFNAAHDIVSIGLAGAIAASQRPIYDRLPTPQLYHLLKSAKVVVATDNGISHLAYWMGCNTIAFYNLVDWRARMYPAEHVCIVDLTDGCPIAPCWWHDPMVCPALMEGGARVGVCLATCMIDSERLAALINDRIASPGKFKLLMGRDIAGIPAGMRAAKGLHPAKGNGG